MTTTDAGLMPLVLQLGRARAAVMDVQAVLTSVCAAVPGVLGVAGAVVLLVEPPGGIRALTASDARARWFGEAQQRADLGPLAGAVRTWRPMLTTDLTRIGPPAVATAAAECGLTSSLVLPFDVDGDRLGVLQLLGEAHRPAEAAHAEVLRPLLDALAARLADVRALHRARPLTPTGVPGPTVDVAPTPPPRPADPLPPGSGHRSIGARPVPEDRGANADPAAPSGGRRAARTRAAGDSCEVTTRALPAVPVPAPRRSAARRDAEDGAASAAASESESSSRTRAPAHRAPQLPSPVDRRRGGRHSV